MHFYRASAFLFPTSFRLRIFTICFVATHLPLLSFLAWEAAIGQIAWVPSLLLLVATLAGTAIALAGINGLLAPIHAAAAALIDLERGRKVRDLPHGGRDVAGQLMTCVNNAALATNRLIGQLDEAAKRDPLTGLLNRRGFTDAASAHSTHPATMAVLDLDHFKRINDSAGHNEGDRVLRAFAVALKAGVRQEDIVGRWGGEEFVILFRGMSLAGADAVLTRLRTQMRTRPLSMLGGRPVTFSGGVASVASGDIDAAFLAADGALYAAKEAGRDRILAA